jgi:ATP-dependent Clp protease adaptor protein ClpS
VELIGLLLSGVGAAALARWYQRRTDATPRVVWAPEAEVALHVAKHEAHQRNQTISALHVVYGLLQDESFGAALARAGGEVAAIEDRVHAELDRRGPGGTAARADELRHAITRAWAVADQSHRPIAIADRWRYLARSDDAHVVESGTVTSFGVLFALVHASAEPGLPAAEPGPVNVVLRNDNYTTHEFVVALLRDVFELAEEPAHALMMAAHEGGRAVIARCGGDVARKRIEAARTRAREHGFPLWIGAEPC